MSTLVRMPEILTGMTEAALVTWYVKPGEEVRLGQRLAEVETEKAVFDYESETEGTMAGYLVEVGIPIAVGDAIAVLATGGETLAEAIADATAAHVSAVEEAPGAAGQSEGQREDPVFENASPSPDELTRRVASPIVRRLARELNVDLATITGTGPGGRITRRDLEHSAAALSHPAAQVESPVSADTPASPREAVETSEFLDETPSRMRVAIARRLAESKATVPHFYMEADCDVDGLLALRAEINGGGATKVSVNDFVIKAAAAAFVDVPAANAIWLGDVIRRSAAVDIAVAVAIDQGLVTPVLRGVERRSLTDISRTVGELAERARAGRLKQEEIEGGVFAISNLGMFGIERFAAIINPPHAGILAVGAATQRVVVRDGEMRIASVMTVTLSGDHRVLDGALAAQWLRAFVANVENPLRALI